jgi:hypothetical protein
MKGSPLLRAVAAFLCLLALGLPVWRLTRATAAPVKAAAPAAPDAREVRLQITFTGKPLSFRVRHLGKEIWSEPKPALEFERKVALPFPEEGVDLQFEAGLPAGDSETAMRVHFTNPDGDESERTAWGRGEINEVFTFR